MVERDNMKAVAAVIVAACLLLSMAGASAYAFVLTSSTAVNNFSVSDCRIEVEEDFIVPENVAPGSTIVKKVRFRNVGKGACFVRAYTEFDKESVNDWAHITYNESGWTLGKDGYRYCKEMLAEGAVSQEVCTSVVIDQNANANDLESFDVLVMAEAVPAMSPSGKPYASAQEAFSALANGGKR